jgi:hypothetical protein
MFKKIRQAKIKSENVARKRIYLDFSFIALVIKSEK